MLFSMSIIDRPPSALGVVVIFLVILWSLLSQRMLYKISSRAFNISLDGEGSVDSLYTNWDSRRDLITVTFPNRVSFLWHHIWIRFFIFSINGLMFMSSILVMSGVTVIPSILVGSDVHFKAGCVVIIQSEFLLIQFSWLQFCCN